MTMPDFDFDSELDVSAHLTAPIISVLSLKNWLAGNFGMTDLERALNKRASGENVQFALEIGSPTEVYNSGPLPAQSFSIKKRAVTEYIRRAKNFLKRSNGNGWMLTAADRQRLIDEVGAPPEPVCPIYFITAESASEKKIVYVGKTAGKTGRFEGGHLAISKLHNPIYDGTVKRIYMASAFVRIEATEWVNLELIQPFERAEFYLSEIELNLIYRLQPVLNTIGKTTLDAKASHLVGIRDPYQMVPPSEFVGVTTQPLDR